MKTVVIGDFSLSQGTSPLGDESGYRNKLKLKLAYVYGPVYTVAMGYYWAGGKITRIV